MAGGGLVLAANSLLIGNNYLVRAAGLGAGEVALVRGLLQLAVFSLLLGLVRRSGHSAQSAEKTKQPADHCKQCAVLQRQHLANLAYLQRLARAGGRGVCGSVC